MNLRCVLQDRNAPSAETVRATSIVTGMNAGAAIAEAAVDAAVAMDVMDVMDATADAITSGTAVAAGPITSATDAAAGLTSSNGATSGPRSNRRPGRIARNPRFRSKQSARRASGAPISALLVRPNNRGRPCSKVLMRARRKAIARHDPMAKNRAAGGATAADVAGAVETGAIVPTAASGRNTLRSSTRVRSNPSTPSSWKNIG